jgi:hypothetical protein
LKTPEEASEGGNINIVAAKGAGNIWCCTFRWKDTEVYAFESTTPNISSSFSSHYINIATFTGLFWSLQPKQQLPL